MCTREICVRVQFYTSRAGVCVAELSVSFTSGRTHTSPPKVNVRNTNNPSGRMQRKQMCAMLCRICCSCWRARTVERIDALACVNCIFETGVRPVRRHTHTYTGGVNNAINYCASVNFVCVSALGPAAHMRPVTQQRFSTVLC